MQVELEHLRRRDKLRDEEVAAYKKQVAAYDGLIKTLEAIIAKQRQIITETDSRTALSEQVVSEFKAQVADYKSELDRVTRSRNFWRRLAGLGATGALVVGVVIGLIAGNR